MILKQATAYGRAFLMVLSSDHISGATGKTVSIKLSKNGGSGVSPTGTIAEIDSSNLPGMYFFSMAPQDTSVNGDLAVHATASGCDPTDWVDQVQTQVFTDLAFNANGRVAIQNNLQQNVALNGFTFTMISSTTGAPATGLTVSAQRSLGGAGFAPCANSVTELSNGNYSINLAATDLNNATVLLRFTATGASDVNILLVPTP